MDKIKKMNILKYIGNVIIAYTVIFLFFISKSLKYGFMKCNAMIFQGGYVECSLPDYIGNHFFEALFFVFTPLGLAILIILTLIISLIRNKLKNKK